VFIEHLIILYENIYIYRLNCKCEWWLVVFDVQEERVGDGPLLRTRQQQALVWLCPLYR